MEQALSGGQAIDWAGVGIPFMATLCFAGLTVLVLAYGRQTRAARALAYFLLASAVWSIGSTLWHATAGMFWNQILSTGAALLGISMAYFISEFLDLKKRLPLYIIGGFTLITLGLIWGGWVTVDSFMEDGVARMRFGPGFPFMMMGVQAIYVWSLVHLIRRYRIEKDRTYRYRIQYLILALALQSVGGWTNALPKVGHLPIDQAFCVLTASLIAYAILRHQLLDITVVLRRGLGYSVLTAGIAAAYLLSVFAIQRVFRVLLGPGAYVVAAFIAVVFAVLFRPVQRRLQSWVDRVFFRERYDAQKMIEELSQATVSILSPESLGDLVLDRIMAVMYVRCAMLWVAGRDDEGLFRVLARRGCPEEVTPALVADHPLVSWLRESDHILAQDTADGLPQFSGLLARERRELNRLDLELYVPIRFEGELTGILAVGAKRSEADYLPEDEAALRTLANQLAVALENSRLVADLQRSLSELRQTQDQLIQTGKLSAVGQLVAGVAHELNNPLTTIKGYSQLLASEQDLPETFREDLRRIDEATERCSRIVKNLLLFARRQGPQRVMCDVNQALEMTLSLNDYRFRVEDIQIVKNFQEGLPHTWADKHQLQQVFLNITTNAQQAMRTTDGGTLTVASALVGDTIRVSITDTGPGISQEVISRIFDPFFTTKTVGEGTGLGLAICYGIVQEHDGQITVESEESQGTTFHIDLPVRRSTGEPQERLEEATEMPVEKEEQRILVVDDEDDILGFVKAVLQKEGFLVDTADTGMAALELLGPEADAEYDLILSDLKMPGLDGYRLYSHLRTERPRFVERIVFMTGDTSNPETVAFLKHTGRKCLMKPFGMESLKELVFESLSALSGDEGSP